MAVKRKWIKIGVLLLLGAALLALIGWTVWGNTALELSTYTIVSSRLPEGFSGVRIAQVSDLHNARLGNDNEALLTMLRQAEPDIIVITGDLISVYDTDVDTALRFARRAVEIAPCFFVPGNHEANTLQYADLKAGLASAGVVVLENQRILLERNGQTIELIGVYDPAFFRDYPDIDAAAVMSGVLETLTGEAAYTILLSHRPELFDVYAAQGIDLVFSGHVHGGQFRLPYIGGLYGPDQGLFPQYDAGLYTQGNTDMLVSRGIGNSIFPFRFNNRPEIILVELLTKE